MLIIRHTDIMFGQRERMWAVLVALKKSSSFNAPRAAMHGCEVGRSLINSVMTNEPQPRTLEQTDTDGEADTCRVLKDMLTDGLGANCFCLRPQGFQQCNWVCTSSSHRSPGHCHHQRVRNFSDLCQRRTHLFTAARTAETEQLLSMIAASKSVQYISLSLFGELKVKLISETRSEHAEKSMIYLVCEIHGLDSHMLGFGLVLGYLSHLSLDH